MPGHFADRLSAAIAARGTPACVGLDPDYTKLPAAVRERHGADDAGVVRAIVEFGRGVIDAVAPLVAVIKINIAFFEVYGGRGVDAYFELVQAARAAGLLVIGDVKRADVGHSTAAYARGHLAGDTAPDAVTVNPYLGLDGIQPFVDICREQGKGVFVLVQTSNPAAREVQDAELASGDTVAGRIGRLVNDWATQPGLVGTTGYSCIGAVVSPRDSARAEQLRSIMGRCVFLVPGYGAQGQSAEQVARCFKPDGTGAIVNSSRGVIYAWENPRYAHLSPSGWRSTVAAACRDVIADLHRVLNH